MFKKHAETIRILCMVILGGLETYAGSIVGSLPYGSQKRLEIARAIATEPRLILLDETSLGLAPIIVSRIFKAIQETNREGVTILLVEQNAHSALDLSAGDMSLKKAG